jgi:hypothetical protein
MEHAQGGPLSPALEAHLASCAVCQEVIAAEQRLLSEIDRALDRVGQVETSPVFLARARAVALDQPRRSRPSGRLALPERWPVWALPALAGVLLISALVAWTRPTVEPTPGTPSASSSPPVVAGHSPAPGAASPSSIPHAPASPDSLLEPLLPPTTREAAAATRPSLARPPSPEPSAIVPAGQADALVRLATLIAAGSVAPPALLLDPPDPDQELRPPAELDLRPLVIAPIAREGADNEGDTL